MRGYGCSSVYRTHDAYALQSIVGDMLALIDSLGRERAVWVGHDWGSPVVWSVASHHPERCAAVANLCVPYYTLPPEAMNSQFISMNRGKRSVCIDYNTELGRRVVERLIGQCDVFPLNFRTSALTRMGLDYATLHARAIRS